MNSETNATSKPQFQITVSSQPTIDPIRTEIVFSRMPLHILSRNGPRPQINIVRRSPEGKIEEKWEVSYNEKHGPARHLAYDIHTLVIERAIEEAFEEARYSNYQLPRFISLKSLHEIAHRLSTADTETRNTNRIKNALQQNAGILIDCLLKFRGNDGREYTLQGTFSPYGVFFVGQKLPDGSTANEVLINLNDPYFQAWSKAPARPLDYNYKAQLPPMSRRFYELVSFAIYRAIRNSQTAARYRYSEYCKRAPQTRYNTFDQVKKQMYKVHKPHLESGYIVRVQYEQTMDEQEIVDWWMIYTPGPKAFTEYTTFSGKKPKLAAGQTQQLPATSLRRPARPRQKSLPLQPLVDHTQLEALMNRGITDTQAREILASLPPEFPVLDTLEWGDHRINTQPTKFTNPPGFYISLLQGRITPPPTFETSTARKARQQAELAQTEAIQRKQADQHQAEEAEKRNLDSLIAALPEATRVALLKQAKAELLQQHPNLAAYFKANPQAETEDSPIRSHMRAILKKRLEI